MYLLKLNVIRATKKLDNNNNNTKSESKQQILFCSLFVSVCVITIFSFNCISPKNLHFYMKYLIKRSIMTLKLITCISIRRATLYAEKICYQEAPCTLLLFYCDYLAGSNYHASPCSEYCC